MLSYHYNEERRENYIGECPREGHSEPMVSDDPIMQNARQEWKKPMAEIETE